MTDKSTQAIGKQIKRLRLQVGLSQLDLAEKAGVHANTLARLERGEHRASTDTIEKLAKALNIKASEILLF